MEIVLPPALDMTVTARLALLARAIEASGGAASARRRLAALLFECDRFDEAAEALGPFAPGMAAEDALLLAQTLLSRRRAGDAECAEQAADHAAARAGSPNLAAKALLAKGRTLLQRQRDEEGLALLRGVLADSPGELGAFRTLSDRLLRTGNADAVLALIDDLRATGQDHARLLGAEVVALARTGAIEQARALSGIDRFVTTLQLETPAGWENAAVFNAALVAEAAADPDLRQGRHGTASRGAQRVDHPQRAGAPAFAALHRAIAAAIADHVAALPKDDHPWLAARPERLALRSWCVMTGADGYEEWHNHPAGWMSGGYYPTVPDQPHGAEPRSGSLAFGLPALLAGDAAAAAFGERLVPPSAGMLALFPSHAYHRTYPHGQPGQRICMAFDLEARD